MLSKLFKGQTKGHTSQTFHRKHLALDIIGNNVNFGYGTPLCAPENCRVVRITGDTFTPDEHQRDLKVEHGFGIYLKGLETGLEYLYWHCLPIFPVWGGDIVPRGQIVAFMGNYGLVYQEGKYIPIDQRTVAPYKGNHLHIQVEDEGHTRIDPTSLIDWNLEPSYTVLDLMKATLKVISKKATLLARNK